MFRSSMPWFGALLVVIGIILLLRGIGIIHLEWSLLFWTAMGIGGAVWTVRGFRRSESAKVFWGTLLFLGGGFQILRSMPMLEVSSYYIAPAFILALGLAFVTAYICRPRSMPLLVGAVVFCSLAAGVWLVEFGYLYRWEVVSTVQDYWPVALILLGVSLLIPRRTA
jgi:hypothetical protein